MDTQMVLFDRIELASAIDEIMAESETLDPGTEIAEVGQDLEDAVEPSRLV